MTTATQLKNQSNEEIIAGFSFMQEKATQAFIAERKMAAEYRKQYIAKATPSQRNSRHFDIGFDGYYESKEHLEMLKGFGFDDVETFHNAVDNTDWMKAYNSFSKILKALDYNSTEYQNIMTALKAAGLYKDEDQRLHGLTLLAIAKQHAPEHAQQVESHN